MNPLRSSFAVAAACGLLWSAAGSALAAAPKDYQITGTVSTLTDTTMTLVTLQKQNWDFARSADTKLPDGVKPGDKVTVHYTMTAGAVEAKPADAAKVKKTDKTPKKAKADAPAAASGSPSKPAAEAASPTP